MGAGDIIAVALLAGFVLSGAWFLAHRAGRETKRPELAEYGDVIALPKDARRAAARNSGGGSCMDNGPTQQGMFARHSDAVDNA